MLACFEGEPPKTLGFQVSLFRHVSRSVGRAGGSDLQMAVEVDDTDWTVGTIDAAEKG